MRRGYDKLAAELKQVLAEAVDQHRLGVRYK